MTWLAIVIFLAGQGWALEVTSDMQCDFSVSSMGYMFTPNRVSIDVGQTVCFDLGKPSMLHNVVPVSDPSTCPTDTKLEGWGNRTYGSVFRERFETAGTFHFVCSTHCAVGMRGVIMVGPPAANTTSSSSDMLHSNKATECLAQVSPACDGDAVPPGGPSPVDCCRCLDNMLNCPPATVTGCALISEACLGAAAANCRGVCGLGDSLPSDQTTTPEPGTDGGASLIWGSSPCETECQIGQGPCRKQVRFRGGDYTTCAPAYEDGSCGSARLEDGGEVWCGDQMDPVLSYCFNFVNLCADQPSAYKDIDECIAGLADVPIGFGINQLDTKSGNTLSCRAYHLILARSEGLNKDDNYTRGLHCSHAMDNINPGLCAGNQPLTVTSFCNQFSDTCSGQPGAERWASTILRTIDPDALATCNLEAALLPPGTGVAPEAVGESTLSCRAHFLQQAMLESSEIRLSCALAGPLGSSGGLSSESCVTVSDEQANNLRSAEVAGAIVGAIFCAVIFIIIRNAFLLKRRLNAILAATKPGSSEDEVTAAMFDAIALGRLDLLPRMLENGADAGALSPHRRALAIGEVLVNAQLNRNLSCILKKSSNEVECTLMKSSLKLLLLRHLELDAVVGSATSRPEDSEKRVMVAEVLADIAGGGWRSEPAKHTVVHRILSACQAGRLDEAQTIEFLDAVLESDHSLIHTADGRGRRPADIAMRCTDCPLVEEMFTITLFERYRLLDVHDVQTRGSSSLGYAVTKLDSGADVHLKLMKNFTDWNNEIIARTKCGDLVGSVVLPLLSASCTSAAIEKQTPGAELPSAPDVDINIVHTNLKGRRGSQSWNSKTELMNEYPFAICLTKANRSLREMIEFEQIQLSGIESLRLIMKALVFQVSSLHESGLIHGDIKPRNVMRIGWGVDLKLVNLKKMVDESVAPKLPLDAAQESLSGAYTAPEFFMVWDREDSDGAIKLNQVKLEIWSLGATLFEVCAGVPLFANNRGKLNDPQELQDWNGLRKSDIKKITAVHGEKDSIAMVDALSWMLELDPNNRPGSVKTLLSHWCFDPEGGSMRTQFSVDRIKALLGSSDKDRKDRKCARVFLSYCWANTDFVMRLAVALAPLVEELWLDRLGGDSGMGEWARASMQGGIEKSDVIVAVVSPEYAKSKNCGYEMELAAEKGKQIVPIKLGIPFSEWPPTVIGETRLTSQFVDSASGDMKLFVDFEDSALFSLKLIHELLPRIAKPEFKSSNFAKAEKDRLKSRWKKLGTVLTLGTSELTSSPQSNANATATDNDASPNALTSHSSEEDGRDIRSGSRDAVNLNTNAFNNQHQLIATEVNGNPSVGPVSTEAVVDASDGGYIEVGPENSFKIETLL